MEICLLKWDALQTGKYLATLWGISVPPSSGFQKSNTTCDLMIEAVNSSEKSLTLFQVITVVRDLGLFASVLQLLMYRVTANVSCHC